MIKLFFHLILLVVYFLHSCIHEEYRGLGTIYAFVFEREIFPEYSHKK